MTEIEKEIETRIDEVKEFLGRENLIWLSKIAKTDPREVALALWNGIEDFYQQGIAKDGRRVYEPVGFLRAIQDRLLQLFYKRGVKPSKICFSQKGESIRNLVEKHRYSRYQLSLDLKWAFGQATAEMIRSALKNYFQEKSLLLSYLLTIPNKDPSHQKKAIGYELSEEALKYRILPEGAITSSLLFEIACKEMDHQLVKMAESNNLIITRYVDDIQISSQDEISKEVRNKIIRAVSSYFVINKEKTKLIKQKYYTPLRMVGVIILPGGRIKIEPKKLEQARIRIHKAIQAIRRNRKPAVVRWHIQKVEGTVNGYVKMIHKDEIPSRLQTNLERYEEIKQKWMALLNSKGIEDSFLPPAPDS